jgi:signal peptidase I
MTRSAARRRAARSTVSPLRWGFWSFTLGAFLLITPFRVVGVVGNSMWPTLHDGQRVLVDLWYYRLTGLHHYDLVVIHHGDENWVKRLVALPGDRIALFSSPDGEVLGIQNLRPGQAPPPHSRLLTIPAEHLYILGDNMAISKDSRITGPLPLSELLGVVRTTTFGRTFPLP